MSKRKSQRKSPGQTLFWLLSLIMVVSMVVSLIVVALPGPPEPTPTPWPTWAPEVPSAEPSPTATGSPTPSPEPSPEAPPTAGTTETPIGPLLPTATATITATLSPTVAATEPPIGPELPTPTATPEASASPASPALVFAVCGDSYANPPVYRRLLAAVAADGSEFLIHTGDLVAEGAEAEWQAFQEMMADFPLPFYPVPGNHDGLDGTLARFLQYSGAPAAHYSFDHGPVHLTLADSHNGGIGASELAWLRADLNATAQPIQMVFLHHPPFDPDGTDHIMAYGNDSFMALMAELGVDYVVAGHIHAYAREERSGVVYLISGGAGSPLYGADHPQAFYHYLRFTVQGEEVAVEVVKV